MITSVHHLAWNAKKDSLVWTNEQLYLLNIKSMVRFGSDSLEGYWGKAALKFRLMMNLMAN